jgi:hypothetical protein
VYGLDFDDERFAPAGAGTFVAFVVDDIESAHTEAEAAGAEASDIIWAQEAVDDTDPDLEGYGWLFLRGPDGNFYVIQQVPR